MGYDTQRFTGNVDEEFICSICHGVLEDPVQIAVCEHSFCKLCITEWLSKQQTCPLDRRLLSVKILKPIPRVLKVFLSRVNISCDYAKMGCNEIVKLDALKSHLILCSYKQIHCKKECGLLLCRIELKVNLLA